MPAARSRVAVIVFSVLIDLIGIRIIIPILPGTVLCAAQALAALGRLLWPLVMGAVYDVSRQAAFLVAGGVMALGGVACLRVPAVEPHEVGGRRLDAETGA